MKILKDALKSGKDLTSNALAYTITDAPAPVTVEYKISDLTDADMVILCGEGKTVPTSSQEKVPSAAGTFAIMDGKITVVAAKKETGAVKYDADGNWYVYSSGISKTAADVEVGKTLTHENYLKVKAAKAGVTTITIPYATNLSTKAAIDSTNDKTYVDTTTIWLVVCDTDGKVLACSDAIDVSKSKSEAPTGTITLTNVTLPEYFQLAMVRSQGSGGILFQKISQTYTE